MIPLEPAAAEYVRSWLGEPCGRGLLDLHHALVHGRPGGLWGDHERAPRSVLLVREAAGQVEAFGAGEPEPAAAWIARRGSRPVALLAPRSWWAAVGRRVEGERVELLTLAAGSAEFTPVASPVATRRLSADDVEAFLAWEAIPPWALAGWGTFGDLLAHGTGFVVPLGRGPGFASAAWVYSQAGSYEAVGVATAARFRGLGLGRAVASALVADVVEQRGKVALWTTAASNEASRALAGALGFVPAGTETFLRWRPREDTGAR